MASAIFDLSGHVALVTGGNGGLGLAMAKGLVKAGAKVAIWGRNEDKNATAVAVDSTGAIYVGEVNGTNVKKFVRK